MRDAGSFRRIVAKEPLRRPINKKRRCQWTSTHESWTLEDWSKILWADESKFEISGSRQRVYVCRTATETMLPSCLELMIKHGGDSIQVWGCFSVKGTGDFVLIERYVEEGTF